MNRANGNILFQYGIYFYTDTYINIYSRYCIFLITSILYAIGENNILTISVHTHTHFSFAASDK